jgi:hypothetical protein
MSTFIAATTANRSVVNLNAVGSYPSGWAAGDYLLAFLTSDASVTTDDVTVAPSGWTKHSGPDNAVTGTIDMRFWCYGKVAQSGDSTTPTWTFSSGEDGQVNIVCIRGVDGTTPVNVITFLGTAATTTPSSASTNVTATAGMLVSFAGFDGPSVTNTDPFTPAGMMTQAAEGGEAASGTYSTSAYEVFSATPGSITRSWTLNATADTVGVYLVALNDSAAGAALTGTTAGDGGATGSLTAPSLITATSAGMGTTTGALKAAPQLSAASAGVGTATGALTAPALLSGTVVGASAATGGPQATSLITATALAIGSASGLLTILSPPQLLIPASDSVDGAWTDQSGGTALAAAIDETIASDADYVRSELAPSASAFRVKLSEGTDPLSSTDHVIHWRVGKSETGGSSIGVTMRLRQGGGNVVGGGTLIASFTRSDVDALTTFEEALSGAQADSITNYADLWVEIIADQT